tara:strand:+ start:2648 stop:4081 length:1434 start_codon:yes stop_codon:yes gene_type:complete
MPLILPANTLSDTGYEVANSGVFNGSNQRLVRDADEDGSSIVATFSCWVKFMKNSSDEHALFCGWDDSGSKDDDGYMVFKRNSDHTLTFAGGDDTYLTTNRKLRDLSAWYHIVLAIDSSENSDTAQRIYINGEEETSFSARSNLTNLQDLPMNKTAGNADSIYIGCDYDTGGAGQHFAGYIAEVYWIDGQQLTASSFGERDEDSGIWKPKKYDGSYANNSFFLEFSNEGTGVGTGKFASDTSGRGNHLDTNNFSAQYQRTDTPTNNFATMNPNYHSTVANYYVNYTHGNLRSPTTSSGNSALTWNCTTIGATSGKWYAEGFNEYSTSTSGTAGFGIVNLNNLVDNKFNEVTNCGIYYAVNGALYLNNSSSGSYGTYTTNDVIGVFLNLDDNELRFSKNGTMLNSSNSFVTIPDGVWGFSYIDNSGHGYDFSWNFGQPKYGLSSAVSDPNGYGSFEYSPNDGSDDYYALCTKNLAEYG